MLGRPLEDPGNIHGRGAYDAGANATCAAVVIPRLCKMQSKLLPKGTTVKGGELSPIFIALETIKDLRKSEAATPQDICIFADSAEAISECGKKSSASRKVKLIKKLIGELRQLGTNTKISWIPAHMGIEDNENTHALARASLLSLLREP